MRRFAALAVGCALFAPSFSTAHPFTVSDLLAQERLGDVQIDASQRWLVVQRYAPWDQAPVYDMWDKTDLGLSRVQVFDLAAGARELPLRLGDAKAGYVPGAVSPSGRRMALYRIIGHVVDLGVVDLRTGQAQWLGITPRFQSLGRAMAWRTDDELIVSTRDPQAYDGWYGWGWAVQERLPQLWAATAQGGVGVSVLGSGRWLGLRPRFPDGEILSVDLAHDKRRVLARGDFVDLELSSNGATLALVANGEDVQPDPTPAKTGSSARRRFLTLVDLATGRVSTPLGQQDLMLRLLSWSPSGQRLLVFTRTGDQPWSDGRYQIVAAGGVASPLAPDRLRPAFDATRFNSTLARGAWLGEAPVVRAAVDGRSGWWTISAHGPEELDAGRLRTADLVAAGNGAMLLRDHDRLWRATARSVRSWSASTRLRLARSAEAGDRGLYEPAALSAVALEDGGQLTDLSGRPLPALGGDQTLSAFAPSRSLRVDTSKDDHGVEQVGVRFGKAPRQTLITINGRLSAVDFAAPKAIAYRGIDGEALTAWLYLPPEAKATAKAPLVVIPYPGDSWATPPCIQAPPARTMIINAQLLAAQGYAVLVPAMPYRQAKDPSDGVADQILAAVDAAAAQAPVDPGRLALYGHSYGAWTVMTAATQSPRFGAVIAAAGSTNMISAYARQSPQAYAVPEFGLTVGSSAGWAETGQTRLGVPPWVDPERYVRNSPIVHADRITAPVFMIFGDLDHDVTQSQGMFTALYRQRKDAILAIYRGEEHVPQSPGNVRDLHDRIFRFLQETIGPGIGR
ncbi:S9 family peptidase [Caulobacter sp. CCH5-E12]|uniref:alpha/beta hydrolase family protein n=1 Tax=Caulobacter sp. CCH5-E12 TaxID=1768770 RepID=UPI000780D5BA|nr:prolyl oligopeptidase family serine peptidase [Caulobacter sp. CCH5-E12]